MSENEIDDLPQDLRELLAREREGYPEDAGTKAAVLARVRLAALLHGGGTGDGGSGGGTSGGPGPSGAALSFGARGAAAIAIGSLLLGGAGAAVVIGREPPPARPPSPAASSTAIVAPSSSPAASAPAGDSSPAIRVDDLPRAPAASSPRPLPSPVPHGDDLSLERELLDVARASLARGNPTDAIGSLRRHAERWPRGQLVEEREVIWVQALVASGLREEAERRAARFRRAYPGSALTPALDAALKAAAGTTP